MPKMRVLALVAGVLAVVALAQSDSDYQVLMKNNPANLGSLNRNILGKDYFGVSAADAEKLEATFKQVEEFLKKRGGADDAP